MQILVWAKNKFSTIKRVLAAGLALGVLLAPALATASSLVSQSFVADGNLPVGSIVSLQKGSTDHVKSANTENTNYIFGVVINTDSSELSVSSSQKNQVSVSTSGIEQVLVSDINGSISVGDPITSSPIAGVGMKATANAKIVGVAQDSFPNGSASKATYKSKDGQKQSTMLGQIPVSVNVAYYYKQPDKSIIPPALQNLADALAGKKVDALPILISIGIFLVTLVVVVSIIYSMIRSSIISVGRNPMSQAAIYRNVIQMSVLVIIILGVSVAAIYFILAKF